MNTCFLETTQKERQFFAERFKDLNPSFVERDCEVPNGVTILSTYIHTPIDAAFLNAHPWLSLVTTRSSGFDHIDLMACVRRGISVCNVSGSDANTVAEHTFALMLAVSRRLQEVNLANQQPHFSHEDYRGFDLNGKTLGVIGAGRIGLRTIHIATAFGMRVLVVEPNQRPVSAPAFGARYVVLDELLRQSHVISLHAPLTAETFHMLNAKTLAQCRTGVVIINTARGALIDTDALVAELESGRVAGVGIDVLEEEIVMRQDASRVITEEIIGHLHADTSLEDMRIRYPERTKKLENLIRNQRLLQRPNVVFTPHVAFNSAEAVERINDMTIENIRAFLAGAPQNVVSHGACQKSPSRFEEKRAA